MKFVKFNVLVHLAMVCLIVQLSPQVTLASVTEQLPGAAENVTSQHNRSAVTTAVIQQHSQYVQIKLGLVPFNGYHVLVFA